MTNNNSIEEAAVKTFCIAPEVYQKIFIEAGEDFPDQLVEQIKQDTKVNNGMETMRLLEQDPDLKKAIVATFTKNKEYILSAVKELQDSTSMFKEGGKLEYLVKKFQFGGVSPETAFNIKNKETDNKAKKAAKNNTRPVPSLENVTNRRIGAGISGSGNQYVYEKAIVGKPGLGTTTETYVTITPSKDTLINQRFPVYQGASSIGYRTNNYTNVDPEYEKIMSRLRPTGIFNALKYLQDIGTYKKGGKLVQENKINKKYIKDSEKEATNASKKMQNLKKKHSRDIARLKKK